MPVPDNLAPPTPHMNAAGKWLVTVITVLIAILLILIAAALVSSGENRNVAVVRMEGTLVTGQVSDANYAASEQVGHELRQAADDPLVEAIVLRVDSPGGTPAAAEEIIRDLEYAKERKPVVVSMGDMATSAAYYVSAHADRIYANPDTFTAGIGVIWTFSDISTWMEREGYNVSVVKSGAWKDMGSPSRPITQEELSYAQQIVNASFEGFIADIIAERPIARADIEDGRVMRGADAIKINVVDEIGNLNDAIEGAKGLAESSKKTGFL